jgi:hypothetical protein
MKMLKLSALAVAVTLASGQASAISIGFQDDWAFNPNGTGIGNAIMPIDEMTFLGLSYTDSEDVNNNGVIDDGDTFLDVGRLGATGFQEGGSPMPAWMTGLGNDYEITATYLDWIGSYSDPVSDGNGNVNTPFEFTSGTMNMFIGNPPNNFPGSFATAGDGINILSMSIIEGEGTINFGNPGGVDGNVNILFEINSVAQGYWFLDMDDDGTAETDIFDILAAADSDSPMTVGLSDSNNNIQIPGIDISDDTISDFINTTEVGGPACEDADGTPTYCLGDVYTTNDGSFVPGSEIPAPGTLALIGLGLLGFGSQVRRKRV